MPNSARTQRRMTVFTDVPVHPSPVSGLRRVYLLAGACRSKYVQDGLLSSAVHPYAFSADCRRRICHPRSSYCAHRQRLLNRARALGPALCARRGQISTDVVTSYHPLSGSPATLRDFEILAGPVGANAHEQQVLGHWDAYQDVQASLSHVLIVVSVPHGQESTDDRKRTPYQHRCTGCT